MLTARSVSITPFQNNASSARPVSGNVQPIAVALGTTAAFRPSVACASPPSPATMSNVTSLVTIHVATTASTTSAPASAGKNVVTDPLNGGRTIATKGHSTTLGNPADVTHEICTNTSAPLAGACCSNCRTMAEPTTATHASSRPIGTQATRRTAATGDWNRARVSETAQEYTLMVTASTQKPRASRSRPTPAIGAANSPTKRLATIEATCDRTMRCSSNCRLDTGAVNRNSRSA